MDTEHIPAQHNSPFIVFQTATEDKNQLESPFKALLGTGTEKIDWERAR